MVTKGAEYDSSGAVPIPESSVKRLPPYTISVLKSYDGDRHIEIDAAYGLAERAGLPKVELQAAMEQGSLHTYNFKGKSYLDRLDIGRVYQQPRERFDGLTIDRYFTDGKTAPFETLDFETKHVEIKDSKGKSVFSMDGEFPKGFRDNSAKIVAQKYFYKPHSRESKQKLREKIGQEQEYSMRHLVSRVTHFIADAGHKLGYFRTEEDMKTFSDELKYLQIHRMFAFNSPVQFNAGLFLDYGITGTPSDNFQRDGRTREVKPIEGGEYIVPQCHACFIKGPRDDLDSILGHASDEGKVFAAGSGIGQDIGTLRGEGEHLSGGGKASGPLSFLKVYDHGAGIIKSGGKSRRAARMTTMRYHHPDIMKFIRCKVSEDKKALALMKAGYSSGMDGEAYATVSYQNTNISVRFDRHFFEQAEKGGDIELRKVTDGTVIGSVPARRMLQETAFGSWRVGDPGVQYETPIQEMHTCKNSGRINSSNPCSEYMFLNDTSCNLASTNLLAFSDEKGNFDVPKFCMANRIIAVAADILNDSASYPIKDIAELSPEFRSIGIGYANLGALLMRKGLAYDSDEGRNFAAAITAIMTGTAYESSTVMAEKLEPFVHYRLNSKPMLEVIEKHKKNLDQIAWEGVPSDMKKAAYDAWANALERGKSFGYRNAQTTVLPPTGTVASYMDCDTTGVEPSIALQIFKELAGGGMLTLVNNEVPNALKNLGYNPKQIEEITGYIKKKNLVIGSPHLNPDHYDVFATALGNGKGDGTIPFEGHVKMLGALQPFITGAISKTCNLSEEATVKDIYDGYFLGHKLGLKALAVFRDNGKPVSPLSFGGKSYKELKRGEKRDLPGGRHAFESEVKIGGTPLHVIVSEYRDGTPGQIVFLSYSSGSTLKALLETHGVLASKSLKRGVDLEDVVSAWLGQEFEPKGLVSGHPFIKTALSPLDYAAKVLLLEYKGKTDLANVQDGLKLSDLHGARNNAFRTYRLRGIDDWDVEQVLATPEFGGFVLSEEANETAMPIAIPHETKIKNGNGNGSYSNERGVVCAGCGKIMVRTAPNCYSCNHCGEKHGGCGG